MTWDIIWQHQRTLHHLSINQIATQGAAHNKHYQFIRLATHGAAQKTNTASHLPRKTAAKRRFSCLSDNLQKALVATCPCSSIERSSSYPPLLPGTAAQWCSAKIQMCTPRTSWYRSPFLQHVAISAFRKLFCPKRSKEFCHVIWWNVEKEKIQIMLSK